MNIKKRIQHYVFQAYLKSWTVDNQLWCAHRSKVFKTPTRSIAQECDFYRTRPLNEDERTLYNRLLPKYIHPDAKKALNNHIDTYLEPLKMQNRIQIIKQNLESQFNGYDNIPEELTLEISKLERIADTGVNNVEEDYYSDIEGESIKWIESLKNENLSFYYMDSRERGDFDDEKFLFLFFVCEQYYRTKAIKERWLSRASRKTLEDVI